MALDQTRFRNLFSLYPISKFVCFESETERNPRMQFFVRNPREGNTKLIRNILVTTDKLIYEIVINFVIHIEHTCSFFVAIFSATIDGRNLIFGHKLHIGMPYRGKRFWTRQIPTSCLPT